MKNNDISNLIPKKKPGANNILSAMEQKKSNTGRKKPGRKAKPVEEKNSEPVTLKFTPSEMELLQVAAGRLPLATFIKEKLYRDTDIF